MTTAEKLVKVAENREKLYEAGKQAENDAFWEMFTQSERYSYMYAFFCWGAEYIRPNKKIIFKHENDGNATFNRCINLKKVEKAHFDFSTKPTGTTAQTGWYYTFYQCGNLEEVEDIGLNPQRNMSYTFASCDKLHTVAKVRVKEETTYDNTFYHCYALENIEFEGVIGDTINLAYSTKLSKASFESVINALSDTATGKTVYFSKTAKNNTFTDAEWASLIATKQNWTFSV